jgi:hypothetical protein
MQTPKKPVPRNVPSELASNGKVALVPKGDKKRGHEISAKRLEPVLNQPGLNYSVGRLLLIVRRKGEPLPNENAEEFALEAFVGFAPETAAESLLVQQMIASYEMAMEMLTRSKQAEYMPQMEQYGNIGVKMMNVYLAQFQALMKSRKPQQIVEVQHTHKHVHLNGPVTPGEGVVAHIEGQVHEAIEAAALALAPGPALLGQDPPRDSVPVAANEARAMPDPRRRVRDRGA